MLWNDFYLTPFIVPSLEGRFATSASASTARAQPSFSRSLLSRLVSPLFISHRHTSFAASYSFLEPSSPCINSVGTTMVYAFFPRCVARVAGDAVQRSVDILIRCTDMVVHQLYVHPDQRHAIGQITIHPAKDESPTIESPPAYDDMFENPIFIGTDYKDDRALANITNITSHANTLVHAKNCSCKKCRDRRDTF